MAVNGPPAEEHLLARVSRWFNYYAGGFLQLLNGGIPRPVTESPEVNRIINDSPLLPDYEDVVGPDEEVVLRVAEPDEEGLWPQEIIYPPPLLPDYEEEEEEIDVVGVDDEDAPQVAVPQGAVGDVAGDGRRGQENARAPSPPPQQLPPPNYGMDWRLPAPAAAHLPADPFAFPFAPPYAPHFAVPYAPPYAAPYIPPFAPPYALPFAFPYAPPYAAPFAPPYAPPFAFPYAPPYAAPFAPPYAPPFAFPHAPPYAAPFAPPYAPPFAVPYAPLRPFPFAGSPAPPPTDADEGMVVAGVDGEQRIVIPQLDAETIGPLSAEQSLGFFISEEDEESPSTSGLSSSTKRSRDESDKQAATKRPRWSDDSDSDSD